MPKNSGLKEMYQEFHFFRYFFSLLTPNFRIYEKIWPKQGFFNLLFILKERDLN